jgi:cytidine deaminase
MTDQPVAAITDSELIDHALSVVRPRKVQNDFMVAEVGCALLSENGNVYLGVCIDTASGMGFCAEHSAIAAMVTAGELRIQRIVAVLGDGTILPPCGRCREFMFQIHAGNLDAEVILGVDKSLPLRELLPYHD